MNALFRTILLTAVLIHAPEALVLRSGGLISVDGDVVRRDGSLVFRSNGTLFSLPESEVDIEATNRREEARQALMNRSRNDGPVRMKASAEERERIFEKLNNTGKSDSPAATTIAALPPPPPAPAEEPSLSREELRREERYWREESRRFHEAVERWKEELAFQAQREQRLEDEILQLMALGYKSRQFSREVLQLERAREAQERAKLELQRAERALQQFLVDARREGILPGWLR